MSLKKWLLIGFVGLLALFVLFVLKTLHNAGEFKTIQPHFAGRCTMVSGLSSSEDITIDPRTGMAFLSSADRRSLIKGQKARQGAIYGFDLTHPNPTLINLTRDLRRDFHPHGISLVEVAQGRRLLFVINHQKNGHFIEVFAYQPPQLVHLRSIQDPLLHSPNDILAIDDRTFYVTNDHGASSGLGRTLEEYLQLARSHVLYYDGQRFRVVARGLAYANGINMSPSGEFVYVAATVSQKVFIYRRHPQTGDLTYLRAIKLKTGLDNIEVDQEGYLWIGAHPKLLTFVQHAKNAANPAPSEVLKILASPHTATRDRVEQIYLTQGKPLSASSVAARWRNKLLIGTVFDPHFLYCTLPGATTTTQPASTSIPHASTKVPLF